MSGASSKPLQPNRRDLRFNLDERLISTWNKGEPHLSHFMNSLSLFFPSGERFFIDSVRNYRDRLMDSELQKAVRAFIGQEAMHGREHEDYNAALFHAAPVSEDVERLVIYLLGALQKSLPKYWQLSLTIALEHLTAILADALLSEPRILEDCDERYAALWNWHALEETEHKSVAFDVWQTIMYRRDPHAYLVRVSSLLIASGLFWVAAFSVYAVVLKQEGVLFKASGWRVLTHYTVGRVGLLRKVVKPWFAYFRPGFHPWDHDNRHFLDRLEALESKIGRFA